MSKIIYEKLFNVRQGLTKFTKDSKGFNYDFVSGNQIIETTRPLFDEQELLIIPAIVPNETEYGYVALEKIDKKTGAKYTTQEAWVRGTMAWKIVDIPTGETLSIPWSYAGQQADVSQAVGSALTYAERYFYMKLLRIPTDGDDPDAKRNFEDKVIGSNNYQNNNYQKKPKGTVQPITLEVALQTKIKSGKMQGKTLEDLTKSDDGRSMLAWLVENNKGRLGSLAALVVASSKKDDNNYEPDEDDLPDFLR